MIIVIDGYNLLKQLFPRVKGKLDQQRKELIKNLSFYKKQKEATIKEVVVVFDGGPGTRASREVHGGVVVVFSGQKSSADEWIIEYVERHTDKEILLVTLDRELIRQCKGKNVEVMRGLDFYNILQKTFLKNVEEELLHRKEHESVQKYGQEIKSEALDLLMQQAPMDFYKKDEEEERKQKKGHAYTLSKKKKKRLAKLKKL